MLPGMVVDRQVTPAGEFRLICRGNERGQTFVVLGHGAAWRYAGSGRRCSAELERRIVEALRGLEGRENHGEV